MILLESDKSNKRKWNLYYKEGEEKILLKNLNFVISSSIIKKFEIVKELYEDISVNIEGFSKWFCDLIEEYKESGYNSEIMIEKSRDILDYAKKYVDSKNIDYTRFVDRSKSSKTSILFLENDIKAIGVTSTCLKIYSIFKHDEQLMIPENIHKTIYNIFIEDCINLGTTDKIFELIRSRSYRSSITDKYIWDIIRMSILETPESYVMVIFNFLMNNLISTLDISVNPINYLTSIVDDKIRWLMCGVYKDKIIYGEAFSGTEDISGHSQSKESFYLICCNDLIAKVAKIGMDILSNEYNLDEDAFLKVRNRLDNIKYLDPPMKLITVLLASKILKIPYKFLLITPPKYIVLVGVFLHHICKNILDSKFPILTDFLLGCPKDQSSVIIRSSYKIKNIEYLLDDRSRIFGFNSAYLKYNIISPFCGILSVCKKNVISVVDGTPMASITYNDMETDIVNFYNELYSGQLEKDFEKMREKMDLYF